MRRNTLLDMSSPVDLSHPLMQGIHGFWFKPKGEAFGSVFPNIINPNYSGVLQGTSGQPSWVPSGELDNAVRCTLASTQRVSVGLARWRTGTPFTVMARFRPRALSGNQQIVSADNGSTRFFQFRTSASVVQLIPFTSGAALNGTTTLINNQWYNAGCSHANPSSGSGVARVFLNGRLENSSTSTGVNSGSPWLGFGARCTDLTGTTWTESASHDIAHVAIWFRQLTLDEIEEWHLLSNAGFQTADSPLNWINRRTWFGVDAAPPATLSFNPVYSTDNYLSRNRSIVRVGV